MQNLGRVRADQYKYFLQLIGKVALINRLERKDFSFEWKGEKRVMYVYYKGYWEAEIELTEWAKVVEL